MKAQRTSLIYFSMRSKRTKQRLTIGSGRKPKQQKQVEIEKKKKTEGNRERVLEFGHLHKLWETSSLLD